MSDAGDFSVLIKQMDQQRAEQDEKLLAAIHRSWNQFGEIVDRRLLETIGYSSEPFFQQLVREHPGASLARNLNNVDRAFGILVRAKDTLVKIAGQFHFQVAHGPLSELQMSDILADATKEVFTYAVASESLVQAYRHAVSANADFKSKYESLRDEIIRGNAVVRFFKDLRNNSNHEQVLTAFPHYSINQSYVTGAKNVDSGLSFDRNLILSGTRWSQESKTIATTHTTLDVVELVGQHFRIAAKIHAKFPARTGIRRDKDLRDLQRIRLARRSIGSKVWLGIVLQGALSKKLDPYEYLDGWFSEDELARANTFKDHSREQVDYLISLRDPLGMCDEALRRQLYELFHVSAQVSDDYDLSGS